MVLTEIIVQCQAAVGRHAHAQQSAHQAACRSISETFRLLACICSPRIQTCHGDLIAWPGVTQEVGADALLRWVLSILLRIPEGGTADTQAGGLAIVVVTVSAGSNGVQPCAMGHLLALAIDLGALQGGGRGWPYNFTMPGAMQDPFSAFMRLDTGRGALCQEIQARYSTTTTESSGRSRSVGAKGHLTEGRLGKPTRAQCQPKRGTSQKVSQLTHVGHNLQAHRRNDSIGLALPEGDLPFCVNDDVTGLPSGLGSCDLLH